MKKSVTEKSPPPVASGGDFHPVMELIDPTIAEAYLQRNIAHNRNLIPIYVNKYAADMNAGRWRPIGDPLRFDKDGNLIDGQHRLHAVIVSGVSVRFPVIRGLDPADVHVVDTGKARTPGDMLRLSGFNNTPLRAAALRVLLHIKAGPLTSRSMSSYTFAEILEAAYRHPQLGESCKVVKAVRGIRPSTIVAVHYIGGTLLGRHEDADAFVKVMNTGIPAYEHDAAHRFREKMIMDRLQGHARKTEPFTIRAAVHVWNLFSRRTPMRAFTIPPTVAVEGLDLDLL